MPIPVSEPGEAPLRNDQGTLNFRAVGPGEIHPLDPDQYGGIVGCPRCLHSITITHYVEREPSGKISLPNLFRCPVCGFTSEVRNGQHHVRPGWKGAPSEARLTRLIEARRGFFQGHRPDLDLPSVAEAKARGKPPDAGPPKDVGQPPNPG